MPVKFKPDGYHTATPYLIVRNGAKAMDYYQRAFGATELVRMPGPEGKIMHAEIKIGDSPIMLADQCPQMHAISPESVCGSPIVLMLYLEDEGAVFQRAIAAGGTVVKAVDNRFYGDRSRTLKAPFGHLWTIATPIEGVSPVEMGRRMAAMKPGT